MLDEYEALQSYVRIGVVGDFGSRAVGSRAVLETTLARIACLYGTNCAIYVFSDDVSATALDMQGRPVTCLDCLHRLGEDVQGNATRVVQVVDELCGANPDLELADRYRALTDTFSQLDLLCLTGGSYLAEGSLALLAELRAAVQLASHEGVRVVATGLSVSGISGERQQLVADILARCDAVDVRDASDETLHAWGLPETVAITRSTDDTIDYALRAKGGAHAGMDAEMAAARSGRYLNLSLSCAGQADAASQLAEKALLPWACALVDKGDFDHVNLLAFDGDEAQALGALPDVPASVRVLDLTKRAPSMAYDVVSNARANVCGSLSHGLFAVQAGTPAVAIAGDDADGCLLRETAETVGIAALAPEAATLAAGLDAFSEAARTDGAKAKGEALDQLIAAKEEAICAAYASGDTTADALRGRLQTEGPVKVSVIIPIYNMERYLKQCLESVLSQTLRQIEVICVDDGSTDNTSAILAEAAWKDRRIRVITQANAGVSAARNAALAAARGEYVFFLDPDDWLMTPQALAALYYGATEHGMLAACGDFYNSRRGGKDKPKADWSGRFYGYTSEKEGPLSYRDLQFEFGWIRFLYHRATLVENDLWFPDRVFFEDPVWFVKTMHVIENFWAVPIPVYCYREGHKASALRYEQVVDLFRGVDEILDFAHEHGYDRLWAVVYGRLQHNFTRVIEAQLIQDELGDELEAALEHLNETCVRTGGYGHVERLILANAARDHVGDERRAIDRVRRQHKKEIADLKRQINEERKRGQEAVAAKEQEYLSSRTWKIGNAIWWIPKRIKDFMRR